MFSIGVCLFLQPFKSIYVNLLEAFLAASVLILLELPNINVDSSYGTTFYMLNGASIEQCLGRANIISKGVVWLAIFYFIPLVTFVVTVIVSGGILLRYV